MPCRFNFRAACRRHDRSCVSGCEHDQSQQDNEAGLFVLDVDAAHPTIPPSVTEYCRPTPIPENDMKNRRKTLLSAFVVGLSLSFLSPGAHAANLKKIKSRGYITMVTSGGFPPFSYFNQNNKLVGFDVDVARALAKQLNLKLHLDSAEFATIIQGVRMGVFDVAVASQTYTPQRAKAVQYLKHPYWCGGAQLFVAKGSPIKGIDDLHGRPVAVAAGTTYDAYLKSKGIKHLTFKDDPTAIQAVKSGTAGAVMTGLIVGLNAVKKGVPIQPVGHLLFREDVGITIKQGEPTLYAALNAAMDKIRTSGELKEISEKWIGKNVSACAATVTLP